MQEKPKQESIKNTNKQTKLAPLLLRGGAEERVVAGVCFSHRLIKT